MSFCDLLIEMALPIISKEKIFKKVDFDFVKNIGNELVSRHDEVMFSSNTMGRIVEEKKKREVAEDFLFR